jgi:hypothetical protein
MRRVEVGGCILLVRTSWLVAAEIREDEMWWMSKERRMRSLKREKRRDIELRERDRF